MSVRALPLLRENICINPGDCQIDGAGYTAIELNSAQREQQLFCLVFFNAQTALPGKLKQARSGIALCVPAHNRSVIAAKFERACSQYVLELTLPGGVQV